MSNANFKWHFPKTDGGDEDGINNSGLQTFAGNHESAIARECIQNSLDAIKDQKAPVKVKMHFFEMDTADIPGVEELKQDIIAAKDYVGSATGANHFFPKALKTLSNSRISILRIGDYNTRGLVGSDKDRGGSWYGLARSSGFSQKNASDSGGSFGIGKNAPFAASDIQTVFYSTLNENGEYIFQGKACIASFKQDGFTRRGTGQYGRIATEGVESIRNKEEIPELFRRTETGTDIFVVGYKHPDGKWKDALIEAILDNFFVAIYYKKLVVEIHESDSLIPVIIDADNLDFYITEYFKNDTSEEGSTWGYYQAIINSTETFKENLPPFGDVELFVKKGVGNRTVLGMRKPLMKIHTFKNYKRAYEDFAGVLIVRDDDGNRLLKSIEPPAHNEWDPKLCRMDNCATQKDFEALKKWIREKLEGMNDGANKHPEEIYDLAKYLPYDEAELDMPRAPSNNGEQASGKEGETVDEVPQLPVAQPFTPIPKRPLVFIKPAAKTPGEPEGTNVAVNPGTNKGERVGNHITENPNGNTRFLDTANIDVKTHEVRRGEDRVYIFNIIPKTDDTGDVQIVAIADDKAYPVDVLSAKNVDTGQEYKTNKSIIQGVTTEAQKIIKIEIRLTKQYSKRRYILGVK